jgi:hypothetical protein
MTSPKSITVPLTEPVEHDGRTYESLTFRRMRAGDALIGEDEKNQMRVAYMIFAELAGVPVEVIMKLDVDDFETITTKLEPMLGKSSPAGKKTPKA